MARRLAQNPIDAALYELEHLPGLGDFGVLVRKTTAPTAVRKAPATAAQTRILPAGGVGAKPRTAAELQLEAQKLSTEVASKSQPSLIESTMQPFIQLGMIGIGAILAVNLLPPILEAISKKRQ